MISEITCGGSSGSIGFSIITRDGEGVTVFTRDGDGVFTLGSVSILATSDDSSDSLATCDTSGSLGLSIIITRDGEGDVLVDTRDGDGVAVFNRSLKLRGSSYQLLQALVCSGVNSSQFRSAFSDNDVMVFRFKPHL